MVRHGLFVFLVTFSVLAIPAWFFPLTGLKTNPISNIRAQDEAFYSSIALRMASDGEWLTPKFLGRFAFNKPPLGVWLPALSVKVFGPNKMALRLPSLLAAGATALFLFLWLSHFHGPLVGWAGVFFLLSSYWFLVLGKVAMTDSLLLAFTMAGYYLLAIDPGLERNRHSVWFGALAGLAFMTKSIAALPLFLILAIVVPRNRKLPAMLISAVTAFTIAAPWHIYQLVVNHRWFWAEYVLDEHLMWGTQPPVVQATSNFEFYFSHLARISPWLLLAAAAGVVPLLRSKGERTLPLAALGITGCTLLAFQYQNATYLLSVSALLSVIAARSFSNYRIAIPGFCALFAVSQAISVAWPLRQDPAIQAMEAYCASGGASELVVVNPDDEFYGAVLPFRRVRYCFRMDPAIARKSPLDFWNLGVIVSASDFGNLGEKLPGYQKNLKAMGLDSVEAVGTVIAVTHDDQIIKLIQSRPDIDFLVPTNWLNPELKFEHTRRRVSAKHTLLSSHAMDVRSFSNCGLLR